MLRISIACLLAACGAPAARPGPAKPAHVASQPIPSELALDTACPTQRDRAAICRCLQDAMIAADHPDPMSDEEREGERARTWCGDTKLQGLPPGLALVTTDRPRMGSAIYLLESRDTQLRVVAKLGESYEPGELGISGSVTVEAVTVDTIAGHTVATVTVVQDHSDKDVGDNKISTSTFRYAALCAGSPLACPLRIPVKYEGSYGTLIVRDDEKFQESTEAWTIDYAIQPDGTVLVTPGKDAPAQLAGRYTLWR